MARLLQSHSARVKRVQKFTSNNKVFILGVIVVVLFLTGNFISNSKKPDAAEFRHPEGYSEQSDTDTNTKDMNDYEPQWNFSWFDLAVLGIGGGFCTIMIIRERRKARDSI